jgi:predicted nucleotidyltransferase
VFGLTNQQINQIRAVLETSGASNCAIFGSRAKGTHKPNSDIDIVVFDENIDIPRLMAELDELPLPYQFDVVSYSALTNAAIKSYIDRIAIPLYVPLGA